MGCSIVKKFITNELAFPIPSFFLPSPSPSPPTPGEKGERAGAGAWEWEGEGKGERKGEEEDEEEGRNEAEEVGEKERQSFPLPQVVKNRKKRAKGERITKKKRGKKGGSSQ
mmetsp:Transcript_38077/g.60234  ORF Transcript_38077/g.60234 Transcript_38077/m.60234 type:complete len:112 (+) Transcript_38077:1435-1770(+)